MSDKENIKLSKLYSISDLKAYYYKIKNWKEGLWRYHDAVYGHQTYIDHDPNIIKVKDNEHDLERYPEIMYNVYTDDLHKRTKYNVDSQVTNIKGSVPNIGMEVVELTNYYHCGDLTKGLFIYLVESLSSAYYAGFNVGDVIIKIKRPEIAHKSYDINCIRDLMSIFNNIHPDEQLIFIINRDGKELELNMSIPFKTKIYQRIISPKIVIKTCPDLDIIEGNLIIDYTEGDYIAKVFNLISADIDLERDENGNIIKVKIDKSGNFIEAESDEDKNIIIKTDVIDKNTTTIKIDKSGNFIKNMYDKDGNIIDSKLVEDDKEYYNKGIYLYMDVPDTLTGYEFNIDENGNLVIDYE